MYRILDPVQTCQIFSCRAGSATGRILSHHQHTNVSSFCTYPVGINTQLSSHFDSILKSCYLVSLQKKKELCEKIPVCQGEETSASALGCFSFFSYIYIFFFSPTSALFFCTDTFCGSVGLAYFGGIGFV